MIPPIVKPVSVTPQKARDVLLDVACIVVAIPLLLVVTKVIRTLGNIQDRRR